MIQVREVQILINNNLNLHSFDGLHLLATILQYSNDDFNFEPLLSDTDKLLFETEDVFLWLKRESVSAFDDIHLFLAGFFAACTKRNFCDFVSNLNTFMIQ